jgi:hypothetical protein
MMKSKLDGAGVSRADSLATPSIRALMTETEGAPVPESKRWTQTAHERSAALRRDRIAVAAYYLSEARGFAPEHGAEDLVARPNAG